MEYRTLLGSGVELMLLKYLSPGSAIMEMTGAPLTP
jgi:hypothetical protein